MTAPHACVKFRTPREDQRRGPSPLGSCPTKFKTGWLSHPLVEGPTSDLYKTRSRLVYTSLLCFSFLFLHQYIHARHTLVKDRLPPPAHPFLLFPIVCRFRFYHHNAFRSASTVHCVPFWCSESIWTGITRHMAWYASSARLYSWQTR